MTLTQISTISGVPLRTLQRWRTTKPWLFAAVCEKANNQRYDNIEAAKEIISELRNSDTGKIKMQFNGIVFTAQLDGYAILNDEFGKPVELHGFTIYCN